MTGHGVSSRSSHSAAAGRIRAPSHGPAPLRRTTPAKRSRPLRLPSVVAPALGGRLYRLLRHTVNVCILSGQTGSSARRLHAAQRCAGRWRAGGGGIVGADDVGARDARRHSQSGIRRDRASGHADQDDSRRVDPGDLRHRGPRDSRSDPRRRRSGCRSLGQRGRRGSRIT